MALSSKDKNQILYYLGWPLKTLETGSTHYHKTIANRMESLNTDIEDIVRKLLKRLEDIDEQLDEARCRLTAKSVDDIELNENEIHQLKSERKRVRNEISRTLDIPVLVNDGAMANVVV